MLVATTIPPLPQIPGETITSRDDCALIFTEDSRGRDDKICASVDDYHGLSSLGLIYQVIRQRVRTFAPFPGPISEGAIGPTPTGRPSSRTIR